MSTPHCSVAKQDGEQTICVLLEGAPSKKISRLLLTSTFNLMGNLEGIIIHIRNSLY